MSERGNFRGGRGGGHHDGDKAEKKEKQNILDLTRYVVKSFQRSFSARRGTRNFRIEAATRFQTKFKATSIRDRGSTLVLIQSVWNL
jgi:hypothetical protein